MRMNSPVLFFGSVIPEHSVKEILTAPGTIKDRIKKLLAHKHTMKKKVKLKNVTPRPTSTRAPKVNLPYSSEEGVSRGRNSGGEQKRKEERKRKRLEEKKSEKALRNEVEQERPLRGDVFCKYCLCYSCIL